MNAGRVCSAVLLLSGLWGPAAAKGAEPGGAARNSGSALLARARAGGEGAVVTVGAPAPGQEPVFAPGGDWARAEASALVGSQLVNQDLGFSRNIFQTISAEAEDVGFGEHYGARGAFFLNGYFGAEAGFTRTTTEFEFQVTDEEAGVTRFEEPLLQKSREIAVAAVAQWPLAAVTPYAAVGYGWRTSEIEGSDPFRAGAVVLGAGVKVPFPRLPVALAFDYRRVRYPSGEDGPGLAEGAVSGPTVSALTLGVILRLGERR